MAIKFHFYSHRVKMAKMCYHFLNVLLRPQILRYPKAIYHELSQIIVGLSGSPKVHCGWGRSCGHHHGAYSQSTFLSSDPNNLSADIEGGVNGFDGDTGILIV